MPYTTRWQSALPMGAILQLGDEATIFQCGSCKSQFLTGLHWRRTASVDGINLATPKGFYSKSRKSKNSNKNQKLYTIGHLPAQTRRDIEKIILTLQAASARTHFRGGLMGSNADFMENGLKPQEYAFPSDSSKIENRHETFITPTKSHENKTPRVFFHPASIGDAPRPPRTPQNHKKNEF